ncbi:MAG: hypothetical protein WAW37_00205 [Syntrophobacteraceae bacterium]
MIPFVKTVESPCRRCENIDQNKEECARDCAKLNAFQIAILRHDEISIKNFQFRYPAQARK